MIRKLVIIPFLLLIAGTATAQPERRPPPPPLPLDEIAVSIGLSAQQRPQVAAILEDRRLSMEALRDVSQREHRRIDESADARLAAVLSVDQLQRLHAWERAHRPPRSAPPDAPDQARPPAPEYPNQGVPQ